eukprot:3934246-Rhodomonas_salina.1
MGGGSEEAADSKMHRFGQTDTHTGTHTHWHTHTHWPTHSLTLSHSDACSSSCRNQFNFSDRACQTATPPMRDREIGSYPSLLVPGTPSLRNLR